MDSNTTIGSTFTFGRREFWPEAYLANKRAFDAFSSRVLDDLANEMFSAADKNAVQIAEKAIYILTRLTMFGLNDVLLLVGNGSGVGAMKIVRSMFESSALAEYFRLNPTEAKDYIDFGKVIRWRRYQWRLSNAPAAVAHYSPAQVEYIEDGYQSVKGSFANSKGKVRENWTSKRIGQIAELVGRAKQYEEIYSLCCSLDHSNYEGLSAYAELKDGNVTFDGPPSAAWTSAALMYSYFYSWLALSSLNACCGLGLDRKLSEAGDVFINVWKKN